MCGELGKVHGNQGEETQAHRVVTEPLHTTYKQTRTVWRVGEKGGGHGGKVRVVRSWPSPGWGSGCGSRRGWAGGGRAACGGLVASPAAPGRSPEDGAGVLRTGGGEGLPLPSPTPLTWAPTAPASPLGSERAWRQLGRGIKRQRWGKRVVGQTEKGREMERRRERNRDTGRERATDREGPRQRHRDRCRGRDKGRDKRTEKETTTERQQDVSQARRSPGWSPGTEALAPAADRHTMTFVPQAAQSWLISLAPAVSMREHSPAYLGVPVWGAFLMASPSAGRPVGPCPAAAVGGPLV